MTIKEVRAARQATIERAIQLMDTTDPSELKYLLSKTHLHDHVKADPQGLRKHFASVDPDSETAHHFGAWKAAQQLLQAAGLPY